MGKRLIILALGCCIALLHAGESDTASDPELAGQPASVAEEIERPSLRSQHQLELQRLQRAYPGQFRALHSEFEAAAALYLPANQSQARGWVILLPGTGQPADATFNIERLRQTLPDSGWHTLSLQLPAPDFAGLHVSPPPEPLLPDTGDSPEENDAAEVQAAEAPLPDTPEQPADDDGMSAPDADAPASTATADSEETAKPDHARRMLALLDAASNMARESQPARLVVLGQQEGAYWALRWLAAQEPSPPADALILLHPQQAEPSPALDELSGRLNIPVADYYLALNAGASQAARQRLNSSKRNANSQYRQTGLREPAETLQEGELVRRVKGWLILLDAN